MNKYIRLFNTVKYLKVKQIYYRLFYLLRNKYMKGTGYKYPSFSETKVKKLILNNSIQLCTSYLGNNSFTFLNLNKNFDTIDWNYTEYGKLWTYNITYFDFLHQKNISIEESLRLIEAFINTNNLKDGKEPFPISLRGLNWIKFFIYNHIENKRFNDYLYSDYEILMDNLEYHLLGNHLLENGYSLLFAGYYFENDRFYNKAKKILTQELNEQILSDGAHFELTPMYHQIMLFRLLDCINLVENNSYKNKELNNFLKEKACLMLSWLKKITYNNGDIPMLNDSTFGIAPNSRDLFDYSKKLKLNYNNINLKDSGYRKIIKDKYECVVDIGNIGPDYIPGHAHSDTFNFEIRINNNPFIVDTGISTYESNTQRNLERATSSHNTVKINDLEQSEIWGGFRVANRAKIVELIEKEDFIQSSHNGYKKYGILHTRKWEFSDNTIFIKDSINKQSSCMSFIHFHPSVTKDLIEKQIKTLENYEIKEYNYCLGFNKYKKALKLEIIFKKNLEMEIKI